MNCEHTRNERVDNRSRARWCPDCGAIFRPNKYEWEPPRADQPAPTVLDMPTGECVGCKCTNCVLEDTPYCCKLCRETNGKARGIADHPAPTETAPLRRGIYATVTGVSLRHGERVKLLDYSAIDGKWYVEHFSGKVFRYPPSDLAPESAIAPQGAPLLGVPSPEVVGAVADWVEAQKRYPCSRCGANPGTGCFGPTSVCITCEPL